MEILTEIVPGVAILGAVLLFSYLRGEIKKLRREWLDLVEKLRKAGVLVEICEMEKEDCCAIETEAVG